MMTLKKALLVSSLIGSSGLLVACGGSSNGRTDPTPTPSPTPTPATLSYEITVSNTTNNQPLSPVAIIAHSSQYAAWSIGSPASDAMATLAESGSPADLLAETAATSAAQTSGTAPIFSGDNLTLELSVEESENIELTIASMLINTNDAFSGVTGWSVAGLGVGESTSVLAPVYDAGTEANDELAANVPGPAGGGTGNSDGREDNDIVTRHPGVVTSADGYVESSLDESHRFDNGAMVVTVTRVE